MTSRRRIVITGLGMISACGTGWQSFWQHSLQGKSALLPLEVSFPGANSKRLGGEIKNFSPGDLIKQRKSLKVMSRDIQLAVAASTLAMRDAGLSPESLDLDACGVYLGAMAPINNDLDEIAAGILKGFQDNRFNLDLFGARGIPALFPLWFLKYIPNMPSCHVSIAHGFRGPNNTMAISAASGLQALGEAARVIERGDAVCMLAGAADSEVNAMGLSRFEMLGMISKSESVTAPFDQRSDGFFPGEGSAILVLEEESHARSRGAKIYAELAGYGSSADLNQDPLNPADASGRLRAMRRALNDASVTIEEIQAVFAAGAGLPRHDFLEAEAIRELGKTVPVTTLRSVAGHLMSASGSADAAAACAAIQENTIPPAAGFQDPAKGCELSFVKGEARAQKLNHVMINASGLSGQSVSIVLRKV